MKLGESAHPAIPTPRSITHFAGSRPPRSGAVQSQVPQQRALTSIIPRRSRVGTARGFYYRRDRTWEGEKPDGSETWLGEDLRLSRNQESRAMHDTPHLGPPIAKAIAHAG
jgi:hypothetical protein